MSRTALLFTSPTCAPCKVVKPFVEDMMEDFSDVVSFKFVDITKDADLVSTCAIKFVPTMVVYYNNEEIGRHTGSDIIGYLNLVRKLRKHGS
jgi:thiol-disulfide isomerase/thioredoxin